MDTMKAVRAHRFGGPDVLSVDEVPKPVPGEGEALIKVVATSVNPIDWKLREGMISRDLPLPFIPGGDFSGVIDQLGPGVQRFKKGDEVYGVAPNSVGAEAEYVVCPTTNFARKPKTLDHLSAASAPLTAMTAWQGLFDQGKLAAGERVLILGGSGGVGGFAIQLASEADAYVLATASKEGVDRVKRLGADEAIDYKNVRIEEAVKEIDLCLDLVGGPLHGRAMMCIKKGGRLVSTVQPPEAALAQSRGIDAKFFRMEPRATLLVELAKRIDDGKLKIEVAKVMPLESAAEAEELNHQHKVTGKIVLKIG
jgi:NADPH:quinone reductase-like Zn-dependent oxidoreductase